MSAATVEAAAAGSWPRSIWAVFAGILANVVIAVPIDIVLEKLGVYPTFGSEPMSNGLCALAFSYRVVAAIAGGYITARLAPINPGKHVLVLGGIGVVMASAGTVAMWGVGPVWYPLALIAIAVPCSVWGGRMFRAKAG